MEGPSATASQPPRIQGDLARLAHLGQQRIFAPGDVLLRQGDAGRSLHVLLTGRVRVERQDPQIAAPMILAELGPGEVIGEMGVLDGETRSASVTALEETHTLEVELGSPDPVRTLLEFPEVSAALLRIASRRLRSTSAAAPATARDEFSRLKSEFITIASHELRTPLTSILGFSELLLARVGEGEPSLRELLNVIHQDAVQLVSLVEMLEDVSRLEHGRTAFEPVMLDLAEYLPPVIGAAQAANPGQVIQLDMQVGARAVRADPNKLRQIVDNLLGNAVKFSPSGSVTVVRVRDTLSSEGVSIEVQDEGLGIAREDLERIFDRFQRVDSAATRGIRGTGLGLYIVRHLVDLHGGAIRVASTPCRGSTFTVNLPAMQDAAEIATDGGHNQGINQSTTQGDGPGVATIDVQGSV